MFGSTPASRGVNSTFSPESRVPNAGGNNVPSSDMLKARNTDANFTNVRGALSTSLQLPRPAGPVMGPGRAYPRWNMGAGGNGSGGFNRLSRRLSVR